MVHSDKERSKRRVLDFIEAEKKELQRRISETRTAVALLGAAEAGLEERRAIAQKLVNEEQIVGIVPEDDFPADLALSLAERTLLSNEGIDLIFINIQSWGSALEFAELSGNSKAVRKLRILVARKHHPFYGSSKGYLTDAYMTHDTVFGHVYMCRDKKEEEEGRPTDDSASPAWIPSSDEIILRLSARYRQWKALNSV
jgi:hypothetical protein